MTIEKFIEVLEKEDKKIDEIAMEAWDLHFDVGQEYGAGRPYGEHLESVVENLEKYGAEVCQEECDVLPMVFGAYFHDSIEDARLTYNDVLHRAKKYMTDSQATLAADIVYALTNEKGKTRAERANDKYYAGIRETPYAPLVKACDRLANLEHSTEHNDAGMLEIYRGEMEHFLEGITCTNCEDPRKYVPKQIVSLLVDNEDKVL